MNGFKNKHTYKESYRLPKKCEQRRIKTEANELLSCHEKNSMH